MDTVIVLFLTAVAVGSLGMRALYELERARLAAQRSRPLLQPGHQLAATSADTLAQEQQAYIPLQERLFSRGRRAHG